MKEKSRNRSYLIGAVFLVVFVIACASFLSNLTLLVPGAKRPGNEEKVYKKSIDLEDYISSFDEAVENEDYYYNSLLKHLTIYDTKYIDIVLPNQVALDDLIESIENNENIDGNYKDLFFEYCNDLVDKYPDAELRILNHNLKTIRILDKEDGKLDSPNGMMSCDAYYNMAKNELHVEKDQIGEGNPWGRQVLYHELSHALRECEFDYKDLTIDIEFNNVSNADYGEIAEEAIDTLFSVSLIDPKGTNRAYQTESNYFAIMVDCIDYDLEDYTRRPLSSFVDQLLDYSGELDVESALDAIDKQYRTARFSNDEEYSGNTHDYDSIIDLLCHLYFNKYIYEEMTFTESYEAADKLKKMIELNTVRAVDTDKIYTNLARFWDARLAVDSDAHSVVDAEEWRSLNVFLSNFSESYLVDGHFCRDSPSAWWTTRFAVNNLVLNTNRVEGCDETIDGIRYGWRVEFETLNMELYRLLGITLSEYQMQKLNDDFPYDFALSDGFLYTSTTDGFLRNGPSVVTSVEDNGDGTLTVAFDAYMMSTEGVEEYGSDVYSLTEGEINRLLGVEGPSHRGIATVEVSADDDESRYTLVTYDFFPID